MPHHFPSTRTLIAALGGTLIGILLWGECASDIPRVLGGTEATPGQFPWMVSLQRRKEGTDTYRHDCGGAIVNRYTVITAAHCTNNRTADELQVVAGAHNIKKEEVSQQRIQVAEIIDHPKYNSWAHNSSCGNNPGPYDVALLRVATPFQFNERVKATEMAREGEAAKGTCVNMGWGNLFPVSPLYFRGSDVLITGKTTIVSMDSCKSAYPTLTKQLATAVCASPGLLYGTCQGDSGGPLMCNRKSTNEQYLAGLVSFGFQVCNSGLHPDVYSDLGNTEIYSFTKNYTAAEEPNKSKSEEDKSDKKAPKRKEKGDISNSDRSASSQDASPLSFGFGVFSGNGAGPLATISGLLTPNPE